MFFLGSLAGAFLDPIGFVVCFIVLLIKRSHFKYVFLAAASSALVSEIVLSLLQSSRDFGDSLVIQFVAGFLQSIIVYGIFLLVDKSKDKSKNND